MNPTPSDFSSLVSVFSRMESVTHYKMCLFSSDTILYPSTDQAMRSPLAHDPSYTAQLLLLDGIIQDSGFREFFYYVQHCTSGLTYIMGPFCPASAAKDIQRRFCVSHHIPDKFQNIVYRASVSQVRSAVSLINELLEKWQILPLRQADGSLASASDSYTPALIAKEQTASPEEETWQDNSNARMHTPYELEQDMIDALKTGDLNRFQLSLQKIGDYNTGDYASTSAKQAEYNAVIMTTAFTRAVIEGGVSEEEAYSLSDQLLYRLSVASGKEEYQRISEQVILQYTALIHRYRGLRDLPPHIRKCQTCIDHGLNQELSPEILADRLGISRDYLLHSFSESVGIPLMEYIRNARIDAACRMLKYSDFSIQRIADYYCFKTQSHFSKVFREKTGLTPSQYRRLNKPNSFL